MLSVAYALCRTILYRRVKACQAVDRQMPKHQLTLLSKGSPVPFTCNDVLNVPIKLDHLIEALD